MSTYATPQGGGGIESLIAAYKQRLMQSVFAPVQVADPAPRRRVVRRGPSASAIKARQKVAQDAQKAAWLRAQNATLEAVNAAAANPEASSTQIVEAWEKADGSVQNMAARVRGGVNSLQYQEYRAKMVPVVERLRAARAKDEAAQIEARKQAAFFESRGREAAELGRGIESLFSSDPAEREAGGEVMASWKSGRIQGAIDAGLEGERLQGAIETMNGTLYGKLGETWARTQDAEEVYGALIGGKLDIEIGGQTVDIVSYLTPAQRSRFEADALARLNLEHKMEDRNRAAQERADDARDDELVNAPLAFKPGSEGERQAIETLREVRPELALKAEEKIVKRNDLSEEIESNRAPVYRGERLRRANQGYTQRTIAISTVTEADALLREVGADPLLPTADRNRLIADIKRERSRAEEEGDGIESRLRSELKTHMNMAGSLSLSIDPMGPMQALAMGALRTAMVDLREKDKLDWNTGQRALSQVTALYDGKATREMYADVRSGRIPTDDAGRPDFVAGYRRLEQALDDDVAVEDVLEEMARLEGHMANWLKSASTAGAPT